MSDFKEWYCGHIDDCEYCQSIEIRTDLTEDKKSELIDRHTMNSFGDLVDTVHEAYKEQIHEM